MTAPSHSEFVTAKYWDRLPDGRIQCRVCPNQCRMEEGRRGICFVRMHQGGKLVLTTYGRSSGFCIDPIEKKPLNHFLPGTPVLSFGTAGCNLTCRFCQNSDISKSTEMDRLADAAAPDVLARTARALGCSSVAFTYNDPVIFMEYAMDVAKACHTQGLRTVAVTAGYICDEPRREFFRHMDAANIDLKGFTDRFYRWLCGAALENVKETLVYVHRETAVWLEITTLLIPGENDSNEELTAMTAWIRDALGPDVPLHFTAFHPAYRMRDYPSTPLATLTRARHIAMENGLRYVYTGNVHDEPGAATYCHRCGKKIVGRDRYTITAWELKTDGTCPGCGTPCAGVFAGGPGTWGARCQPVQIG